MNIKRSCEIELSAEEVKAALTRYVRDCHRYDYNAVKAGEECLAWRVHYTGVMLEWGEAPEEAVIATPALPASEPAAPAAKEPAVVPTTP